MSLEEMEAYLLKRLDHVRTWSEEPEEMLRAMEVLAQVRQAQFLETISITLDGISKDMSAITLSDG